MAHAGYTLMTWLSLPLFVSSVHNNDWKPMKSKLDVIIEPNSLPHMRLPSRKISPVVNSCSLYKASMDQHTFHQVRLCTRTTRQVARTPPNYPAPYIRVPIRVANSY